MQHRVTYYDRTERDGRAFWTKREPRVFDSRAKAHVFVRSLGPNVRASIDWVPPMDAVREHHSDFGQDLVMWPGGEAVGGGIHCQIVQCSTGDVTWSKFYSSDELNPDYESPFIAASQRAVWDSGMAQ